MPELLPEDIEWDDDNRAHATGHGITQGEIDQAIMNGAVYRQNKRGRSADFLAFGTTDGGRRIVVAVVWQPATRLVRPITAWEE